MRLVIGSDHAGFVLKAAVIQPPEDAGHEVADIGTFAAAPPVDYPPICAEVARRVVRGEGDAGVVIEGSGQGEAIAANKVHGTRAALCHDEYTARLARKHNGFEGGRHVARIDELAAIEAEESRASPTEP